MSDATIPTRVCPHCQGSMESKRAHAIYCSKKCRDDARNAKKSAERGAKDYCEIAGCDWESAQGMLYAHDVDGELQTFCGLHHRLASNQTEPEDATPTIGRYHHGYFHVDIDDPAIQALLSDDGGMAQMIDFLSGELDYEDVPIPHPFETRFDARRYALPARRRNHHPVGTWESA